MKLHSTFAAFIVAFAAGAALAGLGTPERTDAWMVKQPAFIVGTVFHVAPTVPHPHPRMRPRPGQLEARYPSSRARIAIVEVLQNRTEGALAAGDTIDVFFVTEDGSALNADSDMVRTTAFLACEPDFSSGNHGAEILEWVGGEWYWNCSLYDAARVKEAFRVYGEDPSRHDR
jgi:hypothetical protein